MTSELNDETRAAIGSSWLLQSHMDDAVYAGKQ